MKHRLTALAFAVLVLALAAFTGTALAGGGNGNSSGGSNGNSANAPGQQTQQAPAAAPTAPAASPTKTKSAPGQAKKASTAPAAPSKQSSKQSSTSASNPATGGSNANGVKPSNTTKHDTYAKASSDQTKKYGNGKTAGQIATQAGYGDATLHGPGNSQPHKTLCGGHEVDVHALKNKGSKCATSSPTNDVKSASDCATTTQTVTEQVLVGVKHSKHHTSVPVYKTVTKTVSTPTGANCGTSNPTGDTPSSSSETPSISSSTPSISSSTPAAGVAPATVTPAAAPTAAGGVQGAVVALKPAKTKPAGGVLGATTRLGGTVASTKLPFTGLALWIFVLIAAGLIGIGFTVRRASAHRV
jgi:hypothetical protein